MLAQCFSRTSRAGQKAATKAEAVQNICKATLVGQPHLRRNIRSAFHSRQLVTSELGYAGHPWLCIMLALCHILHSGLCRINTSP
jgi:hypothetical protein